MPERNIMAGINAAAVRRGLPADPAERYQQMYGDTEPGQTDDYGELVRMRDELKGSQA